MIESTGRPARIDKLMQACDRCRPLLRFLSQILRLILMIHELLS